MRFDKRADIDAHRAAAEAAIDRHFAIAINAAIGPLGALHLIKRHQAMAGGGTLAADADAILKRTAEQDAALADIDTARRVLKARVRAAASAAEINAIMTSEDIQWP